MNNAIARARRHQGGFTLIELLVVIVILGVLAGVVVFAVRGAGDKGKGASIATDERIVRTALEAYCAQKGHYPKPDGTPGRTTPMEVLVTDRFLSSASTIHSLQTGDTTLPGGKGNCPGDPSRYNIGCADNGQPPDCGVPGSGGGGETPSDGICPHPDSFCHIDVGPAAPVFQMVALPSGKVLAIMFDGVCCYAGVSEFDPDPTPGNPYGSWRSILPTPPARVRHPISLALPIGTRPGQDDCLSNCGKALLYDHDLGWVLYDPAVGTDVAAGVGSLDPGCDPASSGGCPAIASAAQILGSGCLSYCGQVLIVYPRGQTCFATCSTAELWNPKTMTFTYLGEVGSGLHGRSSMTALPDGRMLVTGEGYGNDRKWTMIFDPSTGGFVGAPDHVYSGPGAVLDTGDVLFGGAEIFRSRSNTWKEGVDYCFRCKILATVNGGRKVLAVSLSTDVQNATDAAWLFDSTTEKWTKTRGSLPNIQSAFVGAVIGGVACDPPAKPYCGHVVTVGRKDRDYKGPGDSALYQPPTA